MGMNTYSRDRILLSADVGTLGYQHAQNPVNSIVIIFYSNLAVKAIVV